VSLCIDKPGLSEYTEYQSKSPHQCQLPEKKERNRAVFKWVSKVILCLLWFCFTSLSDWLKKLAPLSQPIRNKTKTNRDLLALVFLRLTLITCICFHFWLVHFVSLFLLWLVRVINTLILVLWHSFENCSKRLV